MTNFSSIRFEFSKAADIGGQLLIGGITSTSTSTCNFNFNFKKQCYNWIEETIPNPKHFFLWIFIRNCRRYEFFRDLFFWAPGIHPKKPKLQVHSLLYLAKHDIYWYCFLLMKGLCKPQLLSHFEVQTRHGSRFMGVYVSRTPKFWGGSLRGGHFSSKIHNLGNMMTKEVNSGSKNQVWLGLSSWKNRTQLSFLVGKLLWIFYLRSLDL